MRNVKCGSAERKNAEYESAKYESAKCRNAKYESAKCKSAKNESVECESAGHESGAIKPNAKIQLLKAAEEIKKYNSIKKIRKSRIKKLRITI